MISFNKIKMINPSKLQIMKRLSILKLKKIQGQKSQVKYTIKTVRINKKD